MKEEAARECYRSARIYVSEHCAEELEWVQTISPELFTNMNCVEFLGEYCWVVYASGFKVSILQQKFEQLKVAYCNFDLDKVCNLESVDSVLAIINHPGKAKGFVQGCCVIRDEGFDQFKARVQSDGIDALTSLPYVGSITKKHLARNIGLLDVAKDDVWLVRLATAFEASSVDELIEILSTDFGERKGVVDLILWRYCADGMWEGCYTPHKATEGCG